MRRPASSGLLLSIALALPLGAQSSTSIVQGVVTDARSSIPLSGAQVTLTAVGPHAVFPPQGGSPAVTGSKVAVSDSAGRYEIHGIPSGRYQLIVRHIGYESTRVDLDVAESNGVSRLSFGLVVMPVKLTALKVEGEQPNPFGRIRGNELSTFEQPRLAARDRQMRFLGSDVREVTGIGALDAASLGTSDIFLAMRRMPGVTGFDDQTADLWVRGARWDQVRVSYDGIPMFNPFHSGGTLAGIGGDAIGAAFLHPGVRSVSLLNQGASLVDIRSRSATDSSLHAAAIVSVEELSLSGEKARANGQSGMTVSARRGAADFTQGYAWSASRSFAETALRADRRFGTERSLELSLLGSQDALPIRVYDPSTSTVSTVQTLTNGSLLGRLSYTSPVGRFVAQHTGGLSFFQGDAGVGHFAPGAVELPSTVGYPLSVRAPLLRLTHIEFGTLRGELRPRATSPAESWRAGYELSSYTTSSTAPRFSVFWTDPSPKAFTNHSKLVIGSLWAERRWTFADRLTVDGGIRTEADVHGAWARMAPSLQGRYRLDQKSNLSAGYSRTFQDVQELPAVGTTTAEGRGTWLLSGNNGIRPLSAHQASVGIDRWLGGSIILDATAYARRLDNVATLPLPNGDTLTHTLYTPSQINAAGLEVAARRVTGRLTGSVGYTYGKAREHVDGVTVAASGDRTHALDATAVLRLGRFRFGTGYTAMTGAPYTRIFLGDGWVITGDSTYWKSTSRSEERNGQRLPAHVTVDFFSEHNTAIRGAAVTTFLGIRGYTASGQTFAYPHWDRSAADENPDKDSLLQPGGRRVQLGFRIVF